MRILENVSVCLVAALLLATPGASVRAQADEDAATTALARDLFHQALTASSEGRWEDAVERYRRVIELRDTPQVEFNLAQALMQCGHAVEASELLVRIRRTEAVPQAVRDATGPLLERAQRETARVTLQVEGDPAAAEVQLDGRSLPAATWGVAMPVDPGAHRLWATRDGVEVAALALELTAGEERSLTLSIPEAVGETSGAGPTRVDGAQVDTAALQHRPEDDQPARQGGVLRSPWFWTVVGVVLAGGVVTAVVVNNHSGAPVLNGDFMPGRIEL